MSLSKRVIILNNIDSPDIAQAIFILRDNSSGGFSAVDEAERIVQEYMAKAPMEKKLDKTALFIGCALVICVLAAFYFALS